MKYRILGVLLVVFSLWCMSGGRDRIVASVKAQVASLRPESGVSVFESVKNKVSNVIASKQPTMVAVYPPARLTSSGMWRKPSRGQATDEAAPGLVIETTDNYYRDWQRETY